VTILEAGELSIPHVKARQRSEIQISESVFSHAETEETLLTISFRLKSATTWAEASHEIAWWQHKLPRRDLTSVAQSPFQSIHTLEIRDLQSVSRISGSNWEVKFDRVQGYLISWISSDVELLQPDSHTGAAIRPSFWRAPTDNDVPISLPYWRRFGLDNITSQLRSLKIIKDEKTGVAKVTTHTFLSPPILAWGYNVHTIYSIHPSGSISVEVKLQPTGSFPKTIPRVGLDLSLPKVLDEITWLGPGPGESYPDKCRSQKIGIWSKTVPELQVAYEVPQENGNRMDTRWMTITRAVGAGIKVTGGAVSTEKKGTEFQWGASRHTAASLEAARHPCDLVEEDATLLRLNAEVSGVGSAACGPGVSAEFEVQCREMSFSFLLEPIGL